MQHRRPLTEEHKRKISLALTGRRTAKVRIDKINQAIKAGKQPKGVWGYYRTTIYNKPHKDHIIARITSK